MSKISRDYYVDSETLNIITENSYENILITKKMSASKIHKITISYEIDREVTIKESELDNILKSIGLVDVVQDCLKNRIFGGSEND